MLENFEDKMVEYAMLIKEDADATSYLRNVEEAFNKIYSRTDDIQIKCAILHLLSVAQLNAKCANMNLIRFKEKNM